MVMTFWPCTIYIYIWLINVQYDFSIDIILWYPLRVFYFAILKFLLFIYFCKYDCLGVFLL